MMEFEIPPPLRIVGGSHERGSGQGCAMNVISYIHGDVEITDYPSCSARPLARLVQACNDEMAGGVGVALSPEDALCVLDLGWRTVGTAEAPPEVHEWYKAEVRGNNFGYRCPDSLWLDVLDAGGAAEKGEWYARYSARQAARLHGLSFAHFPLSEYSQCRRRRVEVLVDLARRSIAAWRARMGLRDAAPLAVEALQSVCAR